MAQKEKLAQESVPLAERSETELTPLQKQYYEIKRTHSKYLLFFRLGDFYELFDEDAKVASRELDLMLTTRDRNSRRPNRCPCAACHTTRRTHISPSCCRRATRSPSASRWRTRPPQKAWSSVRWCA